MLRLFLAATATLILALAPASAAPICYDIDPYNCANDEEFCAYVVGDSRCPSMYFACVDVDTGPGSSGRAVGAGLNC